MVSQITGCWKRSWTLWTRVRLVLDVCHPVVVEVGAGSKAFATCLALVWLLSSVDTSVGVQRGAGGEPFLAEVTNIRLFSCMDSQVPLKETRSVEVFSTCGAWKCSSVTPPLPLGLGGGRGEVGGRGRGAHGGEAERGECPLGRVEVVSRGGQGGK